MHPPAARLAPAALSYCWLMDCLQCEGERGQSGCGALDQHGAGADHHHTKKAVVHDLCTFVSVCLFAFIPSPSMHTHTHTLGMSFSIIRDEWHTLQNVLDTGQFTFSIPGKMWIGRGRSCLKLLHMDAKCRRRGHTGREGEQDDVCSTHVANRLSQWCKGDRACACFCNEGPSCLLRPPRDAEKQRTVIFFKCSRLFFHHFFLLFVLSLAFFNYTHNVCVFCLFSLGLSIRGLTFCYCSAVIKEAI